MNYQCNGIILKLNYQFSIELIHNIPNQGANPYPGRSCGIPQEIVKVTKLETQLIASIRKEPK